MADESLGTEGAAAATAPIAPETSPAPEAPAPPEQAATKSAPAAEATAKPTPAKPTSKKTGGQGKKSSSKPKPQAKASTAAKTAAPAAKPVRTETKAGGCPHCAAALIPHADRGPHAGYSHCDECGCCFDQDGQPRAGHPLCKRAGTNN